MIEFVRGNIFHFIVNFAIMKMKINLLIRNYFWYSKDATIVSLRSSKINMRDCQMSGLYNTSCWSILCVLSSAMKENVSGHKSQKRVVAWYSSICFSICDLESVLHSHCSQFIFNL